MISETLVSSSCRFSLLNGFQSAAAGGESHREKTRIKIVYGMDTPVMDMRVEIAGVKLGQTYSRISAMARPFSPAVE